MHVDDFFRVIVQYFENNFPKQTYILHIDLKMSSITSLFLLVTIWQKILLVILAYCVNDSIVVQYVSVAQIRNVITTLMESSPGWDHLSPFVT